ncbi:MAG: class I SAM-dependent methyltransferase [Lachnospiraceae bacterium]|nr:class I SAM-dependent methyltransferase [Lachnospiraceae bacterium]
MKANYKNWVPVSLLMELGGGTVLAGVLMVVFGMSPLLSEGLLKSILCGVFFVLTVILLISTVWMVALHLAFSYDGERQMARHIIEGIAAYVTLPEGGCGLDVGCGSGALTIACARKNPKARMVGVDRWGREYWSFSQNLCEENAKAECVENTSFVSGDATKLDFADESFDAVTSNYVYHNIPSRNRQDLLLETLRTLKKGGSFAIHDIMSKSRYGDMEAFAQKLRELGYEEVRLVDTTAGMFMTRKEARWMDLSGSTLLVGKK